MSKIGIFRRKEENRADPVGTVAFESALLTALIGGTEVSKDMALQIPTAVGCVNKLASTVSQLPIKLYKKENGKVTEITDDKRLKLLNNDTGDTLNSDEFWKALIEDYYFGKGGFAYINKRLGEFQSLHYVDESKVSITVNADPIFKDYNINVNGTDFKPYDFLKIKRKTKDGAQSIPLQTENPLIFAVSYNSLVFEDNLVKKGGNKKGFIESEKTLAKEAIDSIKTAWKNLYSNSNENVVVLNSGAKFKESSNTSVEMQLNENKRSNADEICKLIGFPSTILIGNASEEDKKEYINCVVNLLTVIETALDRDLLLEKEKDSFYFAFDTKEITRGSQKERFDAYATALKNNFMKVDEVRKLEDLEPLGFNFLKLGLADVFFDPVTKEFYTPNTNATSKLGELQDKEK